MKEFRQDHREMQDPQTLTQKNIRDLARLHDGDENAIHRHEVDEIIDDFDKGQRILRYRGKRSFFFQK